MKRSFIAVAIFLALALVPAALASATLSGKYKTKISGKKLLAGALDGTWVLNVKAHGVYSVTDNGKTEVTGKYKIKGSTISVTDKSGPGKCAGTGKYKFKLKGKTLTLKKISDPSSTCIGRRDVLSQKFTKVG